MNILDKIETEESAEGIALTPDENIAYMGIRHYGF